MASEPWVFRQEVALGCEKIVAQMVRYDKLPIDVLRLIKEESERMLVTAQVKEKFREDPWGIGITDERTGELVGPARRVVENLKVTEYHEAMGTDSAYRRCIIKFPTPRGGNVLLRVTYERSQRFFACGECPTGDLKSTETSAAESVATAGYLGTQNAADQPGEWVEYSIESAQEHNSFDPLIQIGFRYTGDEDHASVDGQSVGGDESEGDSHGPHHEPDRLGSDPVGPKRKQISEGAEEEQGDVKRQRESNETGEHDGKPLNGHGDSGADETQEEDEKYQIGFDPVKLLSFGEELGMRPANGFELLDLFYLMITLPFHEQEAGVDVLLAKKIFGWGSGSTEDDADEDH